jgi:hypothetical protein
MIKKLLIYCFAFLPTLSFAQPINSWPSSNSYWQIDSYDEYNQQIPGRTYHLDRDTLIQGQTYQIVTRYIGLGNPEIYQGVVRADSLNRVYILPKDSTSELLLYDFNAQIGDTLRDLFSGGFGNPWGLVDMVVFNKDTTILQDGPHIRLFLENQAESLFGEVIDGVGALADFFFPMYSPNVSGYDILVCMSNDSVSVIGGNCLLAGVDEDKYAKFNVYPNPGRNLLRIGHESPELIGKVELLDARGALIKAWNHLPSQIDLSGIPIGMYFLAISGEGFQQTEKIIRN